MSGDRQGADVELHLGLSKSTLCARGNLELKDHDGWGWGTAGPGEHVIPREGKVALSPVEQALTSWSPSKGMVGKGQAVPALRGSEEEQVWIILGERKEVEKQRGKDLKRKKNQAIRDLL